MLIYYGWLNSFNSAVNGWDNEKVAQDMSNYSILIFGNGIADPTHGDYANTAIIIPRIKALRPDVKIFGYVSSNQDLTTFKAKVDLLANLPFDGVFMDESGYDFNVTRVQFNERVDYIKTKPYRTCFVNAWNVDHIVGVNNDPSFPNTTFNPGSIASNLEIGDWYLAESFAVNTVSYPQETAVPVDWKSRADKIRAARSNFRLNIAASGIIANDHTNGQNLYNFSYHAALGYEYDAHGTSDAYYGASSAAVKRWDDPAGAYWRTGTTVGFTKSTNSSYYRNGQQHLRLVLNFPTDLSSVEPY